MTQAAIEEEAESFLGCKVLAFGYEDGCLVLTLSDGRELIVGCDVGPIWWTVDQPTIQ